MKPPKVSVVMPVYNVEKYVGEAIQSVLSQNFTDFELVIVDDGGDDSSLAICSSYDDPRIRIVSQPNRGLAGARNSGILAARGEYIALLDSDDRWRCDKLALHVIHLDNNPDVGVSYSGTRLIDANGSKLKSAQKPRLSNITPSHIFMRNPIGNGSAAVVRRSALEQVRFPHPEQPTRLCFFDEVFRQSEDIEMWTRLALLANIKFEGIKGLLTEYRLLPGALSANLIAQYESWELMVKKMRDIDPGFVSKWENQARAYQLRYLARRAVQLGDGPMASVMMRDAMKTSLTALVKEPAKSLATSAAIIALKLLPANFARKMLAQRLGSGVAV